MMRSQRKVMPLLALLGFEVAAIVGLQYLGSHRVHADPMGQSFLVARHQFTR